MRNAYGLLGLLFLIVFVGAYVLIKKTEEPSFQTLPITQNNEKLSMNFSLSAPKFTDGGRIPTEFTCDGVGVNPELHIQGVPEGTMSLVLLVEDPDLPEEIKKARNIEKFNHWVLFNIPPGTSVIREGESVGTEGLSSRGTVGFVPACPPAEYTPTEHRYVFTLYALSKELSFEHIPTLDEVRTALGPLVLSETTLVGRYERIQKL